MYYEYSHQSKKSCAIRKSIEICNSGAGSRQTPLVRSTHRDIADSYLQERGGGEKDSRESNRGSPSQALDLPGAGQCADPARRLAHVQAIIGTTIHCSTGAKPTLIQGRTGIQAE